MKNKMKDFVNKLTSSGFTFPAGRFDVTFAVLWFDCWLGFYYDRNKKTFYFCPSPMLVFKIRERREKVKIQLKVIGTGKLIKSIAGLRVKIREAERLAAKKHSDELKATIAKMNDNYGERMNYLVYADRRNEPFRFRGFVADKEKQENEKVCDKAEVYDETPVSFDKKQFDFMLGRARESENKGLFAVIAGEPVNAERLAKIFREAFESEKPPKLHPKHLNVIIGDDRSEPAKRKRYQPPAVATRRDEMQPSICPRGFRPPQKNKGKARIRKNRNKKSV